MNFQYHLIRVEFFCLVFLELLELLVFLGFLEFKILNQNKSSLKEYENSIRFFILLELLKFQFYSNLISEKVQNLSMKIDLKTN